MWEKTMDQWHSKQLRLQVHEKPSSPMSKSNPIPTSNPNPNSNPMTRVSTASWPFFTSLLLHFTMHTIRPVMQHLCACILWGNPFHTCGAQLFQNSHVRFTTEIPDKPGVDLVAVSCQVDDVMGLQSVIK
jgi:hypothetical protein